MFALTHGELAIVLFIFALVWGAAILPRVGERLAERIVRISSTRKAKESGGSQGG